MKLFVVMPHKFAGCGYYRQYQPNVRLSEQGINVTIGAGFTKVDNNEMTDDELREYDLFLYHKGYINFQEFHRLNNLGIPWVLDFDDHWRLDTEHVLYKKWKEKGTTESMIEAARLAPYLSASTPLLAEELSKLNKNVSVFENAMNPQDVRGERMPEEFTFGYLGGHCHVKDVESMRGITSMVSDVKVRLFGYDNGPVYNGYADVLSNGGKLKKFSCVPGVNIWQYHELYNYLDVSIVPLVDNSFNRYKSELKLIEAGFFKKAVIASDVWPYKYVKNGWLRVKKRQDWVKHIKYLKNNPEAAKDLGEELYEEVKDKYHLDTVNKKRLKLYQDVSAKFNNISGV